LAKQHSVAPAIEISPPASDVDVFKGVLRAPAVRGTRMIAGACARVKCVAINAC